MAVILVWPHVHFCLARVSWNWILTVWFLLLPCHKYLLKISSIVSVYRCTIYVLFPIVCYVYYCKHKQKKKRMDSSILEYFPSQAKFFFALAFVLVGNIFKKKAFPYTNAEIDVRYTMLLHSFNNWFLFFVIIFVAWLHNIYILYIKFLKFYWKHLVWSLIFFFKVQ